ncbi:tail fiber domain-containing protein [Paraburkholderia sp. JPY303]|uniref:tail fiber domain-containing protein n=1 Tax=Paraburkholderia atlantica TaxID=2654982 RepID=UPI0015916BC3|nr:tail fiber domain-containing protein [Paraburkholderia atlantica]NUY33304.1 tail fiber domain-containing protein [Paraburkholderia atlantica]
MALYQWSTTPANNATAGAINWAEGQAPSTVNDSARQMMADVANWFVTPEWINYGLTPTFVSGTQFTVPSDKTSVYTFGRRVLAFVTAGTIAGTITSSAFTSLTTVTVSWDSGALDSGLSGVWVGILNPNTPSLSNLGPLTLNPGSRSVASLSITAASAPVGAEIYLLGNGGSAPSKTIRAFGGTLQILNDAANAALVQLDDAGNCAFSGAVAGSSLSTPGSITATGTITGSNITASSDERLKEDWGQLPGDFVERLATLKSGTYTRTDNGDRQVGVGAQSLRAFLPEAVLSDAKGMLSVAYGHAALAACVELAKEVVRLRALVEAK